MKKMSWVRAMSLVTQLGYTMIIPILVCTIVGNFIDDKTGKEPVFTIIFLLLGVAGAFRNLFYLTNKQIKKDTKEEDKNE